MKLLGLDIGDKRVGVAFGDTDLRVATPVEVFTRNKIEQDAQRIAALAREYATETIVAGLPRNIDGTIGAQAVAAKEYAEKIADMLGLGLEFWDERLTTVEAGRRMSGDEPSGRKPNRRASAGNRRSKKRTPPLDAVAAAIILQDYIDSHAYKGRGDAA